MNSKVNSLVAIASAAVLSSCAVEKAKDQPNIIFFLADDMRFNALGCAGNDIIQTPNIDRMAKSGVMFRNAFVTTSISVCSRASILTGQYVAKHGVNDFKTPLKPETFDLTYPMLMKKAGYNVGFIGKYGIGNNTLGVDDKFDYFWGMAGQPKYENKDENGNFIHYTDWVGQHIKEYLNTIDQKKPFCLSVSFKAPHVQDSDPRQFIYNKRYKDLYKDAVIPEPATNTQEEWERFPEFFKQNNEARIRWALRFSNTQQYDTMVKGYYRLITGMDEIIGDVMSQLEEKGLADNTILVFTGDNGFYLGEHGMAGKWYAHEPSIRVPMIIFNPFHKELAGNVIDEMVLNIDIAPTLLSLAHVDIPSSMQGKSLVPLILRDKEVVKDWRKAFYYEHTITQFPTIPFSLGLRNQGYKYIIYPGTTPVYEEAYDLQNDADEIRNLVLDPEKKQIVQQLREEFRKQQELAVK